MWGLPALIFLIAFFHRVAPGVIAKDLMQDFHASGAIVGLLSSTYFYSYAGFMIPAGLLIDAFGARWTIAAGGVIMGIGAMAMATAGTDGPLFAGRFAVGLGATVTFIGTLKIAATWFPASHFGTMAAITATVGILGSLLGTYPLAGLVAATGWRGAFWLIGVGTLALSLLCAIVVRDRPHGSPESLVPLPTLSEVVVGMFDVLGNRHTWPPFLAFFCWYAGMGNLMLWVVPYLRDVYGLSTTGAALYATAISLALLVAGPLTGFVSDRVLRRRKLPYVLLTGGSVALWVLFVVSLGALPLRMVYALFFAMGMMGGTFVLTWPLGREVNPPHAGRHRGRRRQPGRIPGRGAHPGTAGGGARFALDGSDSRRRARVPARGLPSRLRALRARRAGRARIRPAATRDGRAQHPSRADAAPASFGAGTGFAGGQSRSRKPSVIALTSGRPTRAMALIRALTSARARNGLRASIWA